MARIFISLNLPQEISEVVNSLLSPYLQDIKENVKLVDPTIYHCTLEFIGSIKEEKVKDIVTVLEDNSLQISPFKVEVKGCGIFPHFITPHVLWVGYSEHPSFYTLYAHVQRSLSQLNLGKEAKKGFKPHITLARVKKLFSPREKEKVKEFLKEFAHHSFGTYTIDHFSIMQSQLLPEGPKYTELAKITFPPASAGKPRARSPRQ